ncbi:MAG: RNA methyltransferase [Clostridia bacterium]|nr:RNA methyltransferase [Clostridia bacterium]
MLSITSKENSTVKHISKLISKAKYRKDQGFFVVEGIRLCTDAIRSNAEIETFICTESAMEKYSEAIAELEAYAKHSYTVTSNIFSMLSDTKTPQGVICVVKALDNKPQFDKINSKYVLLQNMQDPSNLGAVLRSADALGFCGVILTKDCCDILSPKVCRASMGAVFRVPFMVCEDECEFVSKFNKNGKSYAAVVRNGINITELEYNEASLLCIGNEGNGLTDDLVSACTYAVTIPMKGNAESLNAAAAAGIIMWEMIR